ncbi:isochorismatase family cysteine hydrolase [Sphingomonas xinjiangensis]|uniref:Nicotinamidase-related amidase n=1 Tax=Sphingomonas xinjiangensis TaxID=643568 RepID=A0A840Y8M5_9SPHN|nr:isochorismatase family cysteine hydrolase [Sphingomonas xinjiangensis]MBB5709204.1 nicotinamidase-related amidase [Sphingomonas xinjiangensis]
MANAEIETPASGSCALLIIDMITDLDFPGGVEMLPVVARAANAIDRLRTKCREVGVPIVYVNDNFGQWHSERSRLVDLSQGTPGEEIVDRLKPHDDDFFVIKPQFSGFYATNLAVLLPKLGARRLIVTGISADICILFTAADAHMREYDLWVPSDCVASQDEQRTRWALDIMANSMKAETSSTAELDVGQWMESAR